MFYTGIISLICLNNNTHTKKSINLNESSNVIICCEGDADEELYQKLLNQ